MESEESSWITKGLLEGFVLRDFCLSLSEDFGAIGVKERETNGKKEKMNSFKRKKEREDFG